MEFNNEVKGHHSGSEPVPNPQPPGGLGLSVERGDNRLVITWSGHAWWRGGAPWFLSIGIGLIALALLRLHNCTPSGFTTACLMAAGAASLLAAGVFGCTSIVFEVIDGALYIRRKAPLFLRTTTYSPGQIRDIRLDHSPPDPGYYSSGGAERRLRIQDIHYERHDYLVEYPRAGIEWIAQTLRASGICHGETLPGKLNRDW